MRIVLAISSLSGGGAERVMAWLAGGLAERGHAVSLLTMIGPEADRYDLDPRVTRQSLPLRRYDKSKQVTAIINFLRWRHLLRTRCSVDRADVVLSFIDGMNIYCLASLLGSRTPIVVAERVDPTLSYVVPVKRWLRPLLYRRRAATVVFQVSDVAKKFQKQWRLPRVHVIPNAVLPHFTGTENESEQVVLSVGRFDPQKGHDLLLEAWRRLGADRRSWRLRIVGDGPSRAHYEALVREHGLADSVELVPFTEDIVSVYAAASIFVFPSRFEGFPNALIEAMAMGKAVIASDLPPACREIVSHDTNGLLYDGTSPEQLADALRRLIDDADARARLAEAAREVRTRYAEPAILSLWEQCLADACG